MVLDLTVMMELKDLPVMMELKDLLELKELRVLPGMDYRMFISFLIRQIKH
jgi:hypothetical protein